MTALDIFVFLLLIGGAAIGFVRGFVHEVISLLAWIVAIAMLKLFHTQLWSGLENSFDISPAAAAVLAFAILFVPSFLLVKLLARALGGKTRRTRCSGRSTGCSAAASGRSRGCSARPCSSSSPTSRPTWSTARRPTGPSG